MSGQSAARFSASLILGSSFQHGDDHRHVSDGLIQNSQNRDSAAIQVKLDELIRVSEARNSLVGIEHLTDDELEDICSTGKAARRAVSEAANAMPRYFSIFEMATCLVPMRGRRVIRRCGCSGRSGGNDGGNMRDVLRREHSRDAAHPMAVETRDNEGPLFALRFDFLRDRLLD